MKEITLTEDIKMLSYPFDGSGNIFGFTTTRHGGVSGGSYASLNLGAFAGDDAGNVAENRNRLCLSIGIDSRRLFLPHQVHGSDLLYIDDAFLALPEARQQELLDGKDAVITTVKNSCVGVTTADCVPVLLYCPQKGVVAAIHAGWKGTVARIASSCVRYMQERLHVIPENLYAVIGPSISVECFEVGEEVVERFREARYPDAVFRLNPHTGKTHIDLWQANRLDLEQSGLLPSRIAVAGICTRTHSSDFFSARKLGIASGRMVSGIFMR